MNFGQALQYIKEGKKAYRQRWQDDWNDGWSTPSRPEFGKFIFIVPGSQFAASREPLLSILGLGTVVNYHPHIDVYTQDDGFVAPWQINQIDVLAEDWEIL